MNNNIMKSHNNHRRPNCKGKRYIKWNNVAIAAVIVLTIPLMGVMLYTWKPFTPDPAPSGKEELSSFYKERANNSIHEEAKSAYDSSMAEEERKIREYLASLDDSSNTDDHSYKNVDNTFKWSERDIEILVLCVQHEVGINPSYYPCCDDFDHLQKLMARVIVNRIGTPGFGNSLFEVLTQKNQFPGLLEDVLNYENLPNANQFDPNDKRTRDNVTSVLYNMDGISHDVFFERRSLKGQSSIAEAYNYAKSLYASDTIDLAWYEETADGGFIMFLSNPHGAY